MAPKHHPTPLSRGDRKALKNELGKARAVTGIHRRGPWRSLEAVEFATLEGVDWFNNRRLFEPNRKHPAGTTSRTKALTLFRAVFTASRTPRSPA